MFHHDNAQFHRAKITSENTEDIGWEKNEDSSFSPPLPECTECVNEVVFKSPKRRESTLSSFLSKKKNPKKPKTFTKTVSLILLERD